MNKKYFGPEKFRMPDEEQVATPLGIPCLWCDEPVLIGECGTIEPDGRPWHYECRMRSVIGSVGHQMRKCSCYGGNTEDPEGFTKHEAAKAATALWHSANRD